VAASTLGLLASTGASAQDLVAFSVDTAVMRSPPAQTTLVVGDDAVTGTDDRTGAAFVRALPGVPAEADLVALETAASQQLEWLAFDITLALPTAAGTVLVRPRDIVRHDRAAGTYSVAVAAEALGVPDGIGIDAIARGASGEFLVSFDGWFETSGRVLRPDALYRFDPTAGAYAAAPAFDPAIGGPEGVVDLDLADAPSAGPLAGVLLLGFDTAIGFSQNTVRYDDTTIVAADAATSSIVAAYLFDAHVVLPSGHDIDAFASSRIADALFADGFED